MDYIDLVLCKAEKKFGIPEKRGLYIAPTFSGLKPGDVVMVGEKVNGSHLVEVESCFTVEKGSDNYKFILLATNTPEPLAKLSKRVIFETFDYGEG